MSKETINQEKIKDQRSIHPVDRNQILAVVSTIKNHLTATGEDKYGVAGGAIIAAGFGAADYFLQRLGVDKAINNFVEGLSPDGSRPNSKVDSDHNNTSNRADGAFEGDVIVNNEFNDDDHDYERNPEEDDGQNEIMNNATTNGSALKV